MKAPRCPTCGQRVTAKAQRRALLYEVHSSPEWCGFQYRDSLSPMGEDEYHAEDNLTLKEARAFVRLFRDEMGFERTTVWRMTKREPNSTTFRKVKLP